MPDILLTTLNAKYAHASFGLRYLMANLPPALRERAAMMEFDISQKAIDIAEKILAANPKIVGVGVYIWNAEESQQLIALLKRVRPDLTIVLGGPEVSYETDQQLIIRDADYVITGEADSPSASFAKNSWPAKSPCKKSSRRICPSSGPLATPNPIHHSSLINHHCFPFPTIFMPTPTSPTA